MKHFSRPALLGKVATVALLAMGNSAALAHDPVFGIGPHVLYKGGLETAVHLHREKAGEETENELALELVYGVTGDWAAGVELPYAGKEEGTKSSSGPRTSNCSPSTASGARTRWGYRSRPPCCWR